MSKNNKYYNRPVPEQVDIVKEEKTPEVVEEVKTEEPISEEIKEPVQEEVKTEEPKIVDAVIDGVKYMLNVRKTPSKKEDNVITTIKNGDKIKVIDPKKQEGGFYKIIITDNKKKTEGYAMKKFIKII